MSTIISRSTNTHEEIYSDRGTGSREDLSVWRPYLLQGEYRVCYVATNSRSCNTMAPVVKEGSDSNGKALAPPRHFECVWTDVSTGGNRDGQLWRAVPPNGYRALSDVAIHQSNSGIKPGTIKKSNEIDDRFMCVHESLCAVTELDRWCNWSDAGSGGRYDGATWLIRESAGMRVSRGSGDRPGNQQYHLKGFLGNLYNDMTMVFEVANSTSTDMKDVKRTVTYGLTTKKETSNGTSSGFENSVSMKAQSGVEGVASTETAASFKTFLTQNTTFTLAETSTTSEELEIPFTVKAGTKCQVWQMVATDSKHGPGASLEIKSKRYLIKQISLDGK